MRGAGGRPLLALTGGWRLLGAGALLLAGCSPQHPSTGGAPEAGPSTPAERPAETAAAAPAVSPGAEAGVFEVVIEEGRALAVDRATGERRILYEDESYGPPGLEEEGQGMFHRPLSRAGGLFSYHARWYYEGGAHPSYGERVRAVAVGEEVEAADLRDLFAAGELAAALLAALEAADPATAALAPARPPATLEELLAALQERAGCDADFERLPSSFWVEALADETVRVGVGLSHACEAARGAYTELLLDLPLAPELRPRLEPFTRY